jgi:hypothetical protein
VVPLVDYLGGCGLPVSDAWEPLVQGPGFVTKLSVLSFHKIERHTDCLVTIVEVHLDNLLVVVDDRENTRVQSPSVSILPVLLSLFVIPSCSVVTGHKNGQHTEHRLTHSKGGRRDGLQDRGNGLPVSQRTGPHVQKSVCVLDSLRKPTVGNFKSLYIPQNLFLGKLHHTLELLPTIPSDTQSFMIL